MLQIINEQEQQGEPLLSEHLLTQLIRFYGNPMQGMMSSFLEKSIDTFVRQNSALQDQFSAMLSSSPMANMQEMMAQNMEAWQSMFSGVGSSSESDKTKKKP